MATNAVRREPPRAQVKGRNGLALLLLASGMATAATVQGGSAGPSWEWLAGTVFAVAGALLMGYARGMERRIVGLERGQADLKERILTQYHDAADTERTIRSELQPVHISIAHIQNSVEAMHIRLDRMHVPAARQPLSGKEL